MGRDEAGSRLGKVRGLEFADADAVGSKASAHLGERLGARVEVPSALYTKELDLGLGGAQSERLELDGRHGGGQGEPLESQLQEPHELKKIEGRPRGFQSIAVPAAAIEDEGQREALQDHPTLREVLEERRERALELEEQPLCVGFGGIEMMEGLDGVLLVLGDEQRVLSSGEARVQPTDLLAKSVLDGGAVQGEELSHGVDPQGSERLADSRRDAHPLEGERVDKLGLVSLGDAAPDATVGAGDGLHPRAIQAADDGGAQAHGAQTPLDGVTPGVLAAVEIGHASWVEKEAPPVCLIGLDPGRELVEGDEQRRLQLRARVVVHEPHVERGEEASRGRAAHPESEAGLASGGVQGGERRLGRGSATTAVGTARQEGSRSKSS